MDGRVVITIKSGGGKGSGNNGTAVNTKTGKKKTVNEDKEFANVMKHLKVGQFVSLGIDELEYELNKYFNLTDNVQGQRDYQIAKANLKKGAKAVIDIVSSSLLFGPEFGIAVGVLDAISYGLDIYQAFDTQEIKVRQLNEQLEYTRLRAGYSLTSGNNGENR